MRRIYYSSPTNILEYFRTNKTFSRYSVIKVHTHWLTSERHSQFSIQSIGHPSTYSIFTSYCFSGRDNSTRHTPPGRENDLSKLRCILGLYICLLFNKFFSHSKHTTTNSVEMAGFEPATFALQRRCSPTELHPQANVVGLTGFEPVTPALSAQCSNQLSYKPGVETLATEK